eukprot:1493452-Rhodomonas_salina.1
MSLACPRVGESVGGDRVVKGEQDSGAGGPSTATTCGPVLRLPGETEADSSSAARNRCALGALSLSAASSVVEMESLRWNAGSDWRRGDPTDHDNSLWVVDGQVRRQRREDLQRCQMDLEARH